MQELKRKSSRKKVSIEIGEYVYTLKNPYQDVDELASKLASQIYESIRDSDTDICYIAERHHELKYGSGYKEAHNRAQSRFDSAPWDDQY